MGVVRTDLRITRENAERIKFYPTDDLVATNVQDAIEEVVDIIPNLGTTVSVNAASSPYTPSSDVILVMVDTTAGPVTVNLPLSSSRTKPIEVKDAVGNSSVNAISVTRTAPDTIDGLTTYPIDSNYGSARFGLKAGGYFVYA